MKYYSEEELKKIVDRKDMRVLKLIAHPIEVVKCEECEYFSQTDLKSGEGWCEKKTKYFVDNETPRMFFHVKKTDFCNGG